MEALTLTPDEVHRKAEVRQSYAITGADDRPCTYGARHRDGKMWRPDRITITHLFDSKAPGSGTMTVELYGAYLSGAVIKVNGEPGLTRESQWYSPERLTGAPPEVLEAIRLAEEAISAPADPQ